jgi:uncharacterized membrane protein
MKFPDHATASRLGRSKRIGLTVVFIWFFIGGLAHFLASDQEAKIIPPYIPWPNEVVFISGVFELLGALGLLWRVTRKFAGLGLFMLTIAVTPAHIYMLQQAQQFPIPLWLLWLRLPLQVGLLYLIWSSTVQKPRNPQSDSSIHTSLS